MRDGMFARFEDWVTMRVVLPLGGGTFVPTKASMWEWDVNWYLDPEVQAWLNDIMPGRWVAVEPGDVVLTPVEYSSGSAGLRFARDADAILFRLAFGDRFVLP